jgi:predicted DsbA family dithiol-disulfide isomerase
LVIKESDLNVDVVTKRLASGDPKRRLEEGISRGNRYGVHATPTVLLDGYVLSDVPTAENLRPLVQKLLAGERL